MMRLLCGRAPILRVPSGLQAPLTTSVRAFTVPSWVSASVLYSSLWTSHPLFTGLCRPDYSRAADTAQCGPRADHINHPVALPNRQACWLLALGLLRLCLWRRGAGWCDATNRYVGCAVTFAKAILSHCSSARQNPDCRLWSGTPSRASSHPPPRRHGRPSLPSISSTLSSSST